MNYDTLSYDDLVRLLQDQQEKISASEQEIVRLNEENKFLAISYNEAPIACIRLTAQGIISNANKCACTILHKEVGETEGSSIYDYLPEERGDMLLEIIHNLEPDKSTYNFYTQHLSDNGIVRSYLWFGTGSFDEKGELTYITSYCYPEKIQDEIARQTLYLEKKVQNDALISQRIMSCMLKMIQENNTINIQNILRLINEQYDADTSCYLAFNEDISKMCLKETYVSKTSSILLPDGFQVSTIPDFINRYKQGYTRIGYSGEEELLCDLFNYLLTNKIPYTASMSVPILSDDKLWGVLIIIRQRNKLRWTDAELSLAKLFAKATAISLERLDIQTDLKRHQMLTSLALEKSEVYSWLYDIQTSNFRNCELLLKRLGYTGGLSILDTKTFYKSIHYEDAVKFDNCLTRTIEQHKEGTIQIRICTNMTEKSYEWFEFRLIAFADPASGQVAEVIGTATCIERYKEVEQHLTDLLEAKHQAEESNLMKTAFIANMSHEIRTPLNAIIGFSELLMEPDEEQEDKDKYMKIIRDNSRLLLQLINDILDLSRIESGYTDPVYEQVNLRELLSEFVKLANTYQSNKNLEIKLDKGIKDWTLLIERQTVAQIMTNFINNAIKFTPKGSVTLGYRLSPDESGVTYYVRDTGRGISQTDQARIFERFVKLDNFTQGSGLGLSICEMLVKKQGGSIGVFSEENKGSEFWFTLPFYN